MLKIRSFADMQAGIDMIAHYCLDTFGRDFVNTMSLEMLEFNPSGRYGQFYI
jgi:hypothetical protein